jgi:hypothetical protein
MRRAAFLLTPVVGSPAMSWEGFRTERLMSTRRHIAKIEFSFASKNPPSESI